MLTVLFTVLFFNRLRARSAGCALLEKARLGRVGFFGRFLFLFFGWGIFGGMVVPRKQKRKASAFLFVLQNCCSPSLQRRRGNCHIYRIRSRGLEFVGSDLGGEHEGLDFSVHVGFG